MKLNGGLGSLVDEGHTVGRAIEEHSRQKAQCVQRLHVQWQVARGQPQAEMEEQSPERSEEPGPRLPADREYCWCKAAG